VAAVLPMASSLKRKATTTSGSGLEQGHDSGLEEGHDSGLEQGHDSGLEQGHDSGHEGGEGDEYAWSSWSPVTGMAPPTHEGWQ
jgi:hypothetical protein